MQRNVLDGEGSTLTDSTWLGAAISACIILGTIAVAYFVSGQFPAFADNRGFFQLVVAIPLACLISALMVAFLGILNQSQMLWALVPVVALVFVGALLLDAGVQSLPWVIALSGFIVVPWMVGVAAGVMLRDGD